MTTASRWGIAQAFAREGATLGFSYAGEALERRVRPLAASVNSTFIEPCDVTQDDQIRAVMEKARASFGEIDILVHAIAFAGRDELSRPYYKTSRAGFHLAMDISVYSFTALAREALPLMRPGGAMITLTYHGSVKAVTHYNVMGVAKAALESSVRYLAVDLGSHEKHIRVNAISAGPIRTLSAAGVAGFKSMYAASRTWRPCAVTSPSRTSATPRFTCARIWPRASRAKSITSIPATMSSECPPATRLAKPE